MDEFMYKNKRYNTKYAGTPRQEVGRYGVNGKFVNSNTFNNNSKQYQYDKRQLHYRYPYLYDIGNMDMRMNMNMNILLIIVYRLKKKNYLV